MPIPPSYSEITLADYMVTCLGKVAAVLELVSADFEESVIDVLLQYGVSDISSATNIQKLRALAKVAAWKKAVEEVSVSYDFSADGGSYNRSQMQELCAKSLAAAESDAGDYLPALRIGIDTLSFSQDPYNYSGGEDYGIG